MNRKKSPPRANRKSGRFTAGFIVPPKERGSEREVFLVQFHQTFQTTFDAALVAGGTR